MPVVNGNEPDGSFYLKYKCESSVTGVLVTVLNGDADIVLATAGAVVGDTLRVNTIVGSVDDSTTNWRYFKVSAVSDTTTVTVENAADVDFADGSYYAEYGDFYSGPGEEYGVSTGCLQADPDSTNNPLGHNVDALALQNELQGLAQVNSAADCLKVIYSSDALFQWLVTVAPVKRYYSITHMSKDITKYSRHRGSRKTASA